MLRYSVSKLSVTLRRPVYSSKSGSQGKTLQLSVRFVYVCKISYVITVDYLNLPSGTVRILP